MLCERKAKNKGSEFSGFHFQHNVQLTAHICHWSEMVEGNSLLKNLTIGGFEC